MYHMYILYIFDIWMFSGTAGGIGSVMAALGALKLGALTILNADSLDIETRWWFINISVLVIYWYISIGDILVYWSHIGALKVGALTLIHADYLDIEKGGDLVIIMVQDHVVPQYMVFLHIYTFLTQVQKLDYENFHSYRHIYRAVSKEGRNTAKNR